MSLILASLVVAITISLLPLFPGEEDEVIYLRSCKPGEGCQKNRSPKDCGCCLGKAEEGKTKEEVKK